MTIASDISKTGFIGSNSTGPFLFGFKFYQNGEIIVVKTDSAEVETVLSEGADYTLSGAGLDTGGSVTLNAVLAIGESLSVSRVIDILQETAFRNQGAFYPELHETAFDKLTMMVQQVDANANEALNGMAAVQAAVAGVVPENVISSQLYAGSVVVVPGNYDSLEEARTAPGAVGKTVLVLSELTQAQSNITGAWPADRALRVDNGGIIVNSTTFTISGTFSSVGQAFNGAGAVTFTVDVVNPNGWFKAGQVVTFNAGLEAGPSLISTGMVLASTCTASVVKPEWFGVKADNLDGSATANTSGFALASTQAGVLRTMVLGDGIYKVTSSGDAYAVTVSCPIKGNSPNTSVIKNIGTGNTLLLQGVATVDPKTYYNRWSNFGVVGNASSKDGITTAITGAATNELAYCTITSVDSSFNGRHGLVHRFAWGTRYNDCKFYENGGLGIYQHVETTGVSGSSANALSFFQCESRHNGGSAAGTLYSDTKGGMKFTGGAAINWHGGVIESNNGWGVLIDASASPEPISGISFSNVYMEGSPAGATVGGFFHTTNSNWYALSVKNSYFLYGGTAGQTVTIFDITPNLFTSTGGMTPSFSEEGNTFDLLGTNAATVAIYGASTKTLLPARTLTSNVFGDLGFANTPQTNTILTVTADQGAVFWGWTIDGWIHLRRNDDTIAQRYPFTVTFTNGGGITVSVGTTITGTTISAPTMAMSGNNLQITTAGSYYAWVEVNDGGIGASTANPAVLSAPTTLTYNPVLFGNVARRK